MILGGHTRSAVAFARLLPGVTTGGDEDKLNFNTRINGGTNETDEALLDGISIMESNFQPERYRACRYRTSHVAGIHPGNNAVDV